jgi:hypothetical protein
MKFQAFGETFEGKIKFNNYADGNRAVQLLSFNNEYEGWEPFATLSVNTDKKLPQDQFVAKMYSENEGLVEQFIEMGYFEAVEDQYVTVGYAGPQPVLRILKEN